jgi:glycine hydroxymethyltransferase
MVDVLSSVTPTSTSTGAPSKAKYVLADGVADKTHSASAELLDKHPLYPGLDLN